MANKYTAQKIDIDRVIQLYESGMTQVEIAETLGTTQKVIWQRLRNLNYKCRIPKKRNQRGENNDSWKGEKAKYAALHYRLYSLRGRPSRCAMCDTEGAKRFEWANLTGKYEDPFDYIRVCKSCHSRLDGIVKNLERGNQRCRS